MSRSKPDQIGGMSEVIPILPVRNVVLFPNIPTQLLVGCEESRQLVKDSVAADRLIGVFTQIDGDKENPGTADIHAVGVLATIHRVYKLPDDHLQVLVRGTKRIRVDEVVTETPFTYGPGTLPPKITPTAVKGSSLWRKISRSSSKRSCPSRPVSTAS